MRESFRLRRPARPPVERLEPRALLSATIVHSLPNATLAQDSPQSIDLSSSFDDPSISGTLVSMQTTLGGITLELDDNVAPATVANFLNYVNDGLYSGTIIHRVVDDTATPFQVIQGGGYLPDGTPITSLGTVQNEFNLSNVRGTIAMAKVADDPNSATSQWFINDSDNTFLDTSDGGFTVFGQVLTGMNIVDLIDSLGTVDGTALNPDFGNSLPTVDALAPGTVPAPIDLVQIPSVTVIPKVSFAAVSDNTGVVSATLTGTQLTLTPVPGVSGFAHVAVTATDLSGTSVTDDISVEVTPAGARALDVTLGAGHARTIGYKDSDGTKAKVSFNGPGTAVLHFAGDGLHIAAGAPHVVAFNLLLMGIDATGTGAASSFTITANGGKDGIVTVGGLTTDGSFGSVKLIRTQVLGNVTIAGGVGDFRCDYARGGTLSLGGAALRNTPLTVLGNSWVDENLVATTEIGQFKTFNWVNSDNVGEVVSAPVIKNLVAFGNLTPGLQLSGAIGSKTLGRLVVRGAIGGSWNVAGGVPNLIVGGVTPDFNGVFPTPIRRLVVAGDFLGSLTAPLVSEMIVRGTMANATLKLTGAGRSLGTLTVNRGITSSVIDATGSIVSITSKFLNDSIVYAGIGSASGDTALPETVADITVNNFPGQASIAAINLTAPAGNTFVNSNVAAAFIGTLQLGATFTQNSATPFGIATASLGHLNVVDRSKKQTIALTSVQDAAGLAAQVAARQLDLGDLKINIV